MLDIGLEVKILRERLQMSAKELAEKIGLSQSQMSRLEKGQRRIDTSVLARISEALGVDPSHFFRGEEVPADGVIQPTAPSSVGKEIRSERRKRHISAEDLAARLGMQKHQIYAIEEGKRPLSPEIAEKICRVLKLPTNHFLTHQQHAIESLEAQITRLNQALAESHRGASFDPATGTSGAATGESEDDDALRRRRGVPILGTLSSGYPSTFDAIGRPTGEPEDFLYLPSVVDPTAFAVEVLGDSMESAVQPSFAEGDLAVFADGQVKSRDFALVRRSARESIGGSAGEVALRQVFFEPQGRVRLQPLNLQYGAEYCHREEILGMWRLVALVSGY